MVFRLGSSEVGMVVMGWSEKRLWRMLGVRREIELVGVLMALS